MYVWLMYSFSLVWLFLFIQGLKRTNLNRVTQCLFSFSKQPESNKYFLEKKLTKIYHS